MKRIIAAAIIGAGIIAGSWFVVFPEATLLSLVSNSLSGSGLAMDVAGFRKGYFYDFTAENAALKKSDRTLVIVKDLSCRLDLPSLLRLKPEVRCTGEIAGGRINGSVALLRDNGPVRVRIADVRLDEMPVFSSLAVGGSGLLSGRLNLEQGRGNILFALKDTHLQPVSFGGIRIPLDVFSDGTGALALDGSTIKITSFSLEGKGIYARVRGNITGNMLRLKLELMPEKAFVEGNPVFGLLGAYRDSPGHYLIPITTMVNF